MQGFRVLGVSMDSATQETREFLENQDSQEIVVNRDTQGFQGFVMFPCVIRPTTSGNITAKDPMSDDTAAWEEAIYCITHLQRCVWLLTPLCVCVENSCTGGRNNLIGWVKLREAGHWFMIMGFIIEDGQVAGDLAFWDTRLTWLLYALNLQSLNSRFKQSKSQMSTEMVGTEFCWFFSN